MTDVVTAGLDLLSGGERHADRLALACAERLEAAGGADVLISSHPATTGEHRHVALVVEVAGLTGAAVHEALSEAADEEGEGRRGLVVGASSEGDAELVAVLRSVLAGHAGGSGGRAVVFPGQSDLPTTTTVAELLGSTAVQRVQVLGGTEPDPGTTLLTRGFLRPRWVEGALVLHVQPAIGDVLVPFETPDPTPCCAVHA